jgi:hypothetical protein
MALSQSLPLTGMLRVGPEEAQKMGGSSCGPLSWWRSGSGDLATPEGLDDAHLSATVGAWLT